MAISKGSAAGFEGDINLGVVFAMLRQGRLDANGLHLILEEVVQGDIASIRGFEERIRDEIAPAPVSV